jgi:hypothetical protein
VPGVRRDPSSCTLNAFQLAPSSFPMFAGDIPRHATRLEFMKDCDLGNSIVDCHPRVSQGILECLDQRETSESKKGKLPDQGASP